MGDSSARAAASPAGCAAPSAAAPTPSDAPASGASSDTRHAAAAAAPPAPEAADGDASQKPARRRRAASPPPERPLLSDSQWEREIAGFGRVLDDVLRCVTNRDLVARTAAYMATFPQHALRFQIKMKQRAYAEGARGFQPKLMLFYVLHEFLKSFDGERLQQVQREWFQTVDEVLNACAREIRYGDKRNSEENRKRVFKTLARWEELKLYPRKIKAWKGLVMGECKPRRAPVPLPRSETERQAEAPDQLQQFELPPPSTPRLQLDRSNCPLVFERHNFDSKPEEKQHWRYTAIAFIDILSRCLGLNSDIALTACVFFHRIFDRGIYARERYKFAAACLFLSAKASSKRMKLLRMVRIMYDILETPLFAGDEELLEIERLQLLYYEMEVLQGINFELTMEMPFYYLRRVLEEMPEKFRNAINEDAQTVLEELFFSPVCVDISPQLLGEAAAYIATWNKGKDFKFKWCSPNEDGQVFNERIARDALRGYRSLQRWKTNQQAEFDELVTASNALEGEDKAAKLKEAFKPQLGGLRLDPSVILNEAEFTKKAEEDTKQWIKTSSRNGSGNRSNDQHVSSKREARNGSHSASSTSKKYREGDEPRIKVESRSQASTRDEEYRRTYSDTRDRDRHRQRSRSRSRSEYEREDSRARSGDRRDRDRYDYDDYDESDRYRERKRDDKHSYRDRSSNYDRDDRGDDRDERSYDRNDRGYDRDDRGYDRSDRGYDRTDRGYDRTDQRYDRTDRGYDRRSDRDLDYRRDPSYFDRRDRKLDRESGSNYREHDYHEQNSRSNSRSRSRSRSPRESSRNSRKRKRNYSTRDRSASSSRSSSRSRSRDRSRSSYYRTEDPSPSSSRSTRTSRSNKYGSLRASQRDTDRPRIKQERSAA